MNYRQKTRIAIGVAVFFALFLAAVLFVPGLRNLDFAQGITAVLITGFIAVELFILVPVPTKIAVPVAGLSAAIFYLTVFPQIKDTIISKKTTQTITGTIYRKGTDYPIPAKARVWVRGSNISSETDGRGSFALLNVPLDVNSIVITYAGRDKDFDINSTGKYEMDITEDKVEIQGLQKLDATAWSETPKNNCAKFKGKNSAVQLFVLSKDNIASPPGFQDLMVQVQIKGGGEIVYAQPNDPAQKIAQVEDEGENETQNSIRKWRVPVNGNVTNFKLSFCTGTKKNASPVTVDNWDAKFWFQKEGIS